jgi:predicted amino acid dehydrogenase
VIKGGVVRLPGNPDFRISGVPLENGIIFACMAETMLMGLENLHDHFSYGKLEIEKVFKIISIADRHGFALGRAKVENSY